MHTIKGNARTLGFSYITDRVRDAEQTYDALRLKEDKHWDEGRMNHELRLVEEIIRKYDEIFVDKLCRDDTSTLTPDSPQIQEMCQALNALDFNNVALLKGFVQKVKETFSEFGTEDVDEMLSGICHAMPSLASELHKPAPKISIVGGNVRMPFELSGILRDVRVLTSVAFLALHFTIEEKFSIEHHVLKV